MSRIDYLILHVITGIMLDPKIRNLTTLSLLPLVNNCFSLSSFFQSLLYFLWIGAQFPQVKFLSYGRILTLHYYFLLMCILLSFLLSHVMAFPFFIFLIILRLRVYLSLKMARDQQLLKKRQPGRETRLITSTI